MSGFNELFSLFFYKLTIFRKMSGDLDHLDMSRSGRDTVDFVDASSRTGGDTADLDVELENYIADIDDIIVNNANK